VPYARAVDSEPPLLAPPALEEIRSRVDEVLDAFLLAQKDEVMGLAPEAGIMVDELLRLVRAGGKRIRPAFCYWGFEAAGGVDGPPIVRVAAALELFHTFALIHDDVMDESDTRRGVPTTEVRFARARTGHPDAPRYGRSVAVLAGDLAAVLADTLLLDSGFPPERLLPALGRYARMRIEVAAGQLLDISERAGAASGDARVAWLKTGAYTVEGPLHLGALLAGSTPDLLAVLSRYASPLGRAFQLRDDVLDLGDRAAGATPAAVNALIEEAGAAIEDAAIPPEPLHALRSLARALTLPEG
jgi:geranylgeranyl diphosphate synthase type I